MTSIEGVHPGVTRGRLSFGRALAFAGLTIGVLHFCIALVFLLASGWIRSLAERPFVWGPMYGVAVWAVMFFVVLPLSAAAPSTLTWPVVVNEIAIHVLGVGLPAALFARRLRLG